jgi:hypothetical protein
MYSEYNRLQLPGPVFEPSRSVSRSPSRAAGFLLLVLIISGVGYALARYWAAMAAKSGAVDAVTPVATATSPISMADAEDLLRHLEDVATNNLKASEEMKRSREWADRVLPVMEQQHMVVEKRRIQAAQAASDSAQRYIQQARDELEITRNLLIERSKRKR